MLSLTNISAKSASTYYQKATNEYYQKSGSYGQWYGTLVSEFNLPDSNSPSEFNFEAFNKLLNGFDPEGKPLLKSSGKVNHRAGLDLTFSAPKSVSLLSLVDDRLLTAHDKSVNATLDYIEKNYTETRIMEDGLVYTESTQKLLIAKFEHHLNRNQEPHLHTHSVIANLTVDSKNKFKSIRNDLIYRDQLFLGLIFRNHLAREIQGLGYKIDVDQEKGFFEIRGVSKEIINAFSTRRQEVIKKKEFLEEKQSDPASSLHRVSHARLMEIATLDSRAKKQKELPRDVTIENVNNKLTAEHHTSLTAILSGCASNQDLNESPSPHVFERPLFEIMHEAVSLVEDKFSAWKERTLLEFSLKLTIGQYTLEDHKQAFQHLNKIEAIKNLGEHKNTNYFSSPEMIQIEKNIFSLINKGVSKFNESHHHPQIDSSLLESTLNKLTPSQQQALEFCLTSKDQFIGLQGDAGTGKTFLIKNLKELLPSYNFTGLAPTGKAALELTNSAGIKKSMTIDAFLIQENNRPSSETTPDTSLYYNIKTFPHFPIPITPFWIIDEAGMVGSKKMERLLNLASAQGAKVLIMGDHKQFSSIEQGKIFKDLQASKILATAELTDVIRQKTSITKNLVSDLNAYIKDSSKINHLESMFRSLDSENLLHELPDDKKILTISSTYLKLRQEHPGEDVLLITSTNQDRQDLNQHIRDELQKNQLIGSKNFLFKSLVPVNLNAIAKKNAGNYQKGLYLRFTLNHFSFKKNESYEIVNIDQEKNLLTLSPVTNPSSEKEITLSLSELSNNFFKKLNIYNPQEKNLSLHDKIIFTQNIKDLSLKNGQTALITEIDHNGDVTIELLDSHNSRSVKLNIGLSSQSHPFFDHAYALTEYKSQGNTVDHLIWSSPHEKLNLKSAYVAMTRPRKSIQIFTNNESEWKNNLSREKNERSVYDFLSHSFETRLQEKQEQKSFETSQNKGRLNNINTIQKYTSKELSR